MRSKMRAKITKTVYTGGNILHVGETVYGETITDLEEKYGVLWPGPKSFVTDDGVVIFPGYFKRSWTMRVFDALFKLTNS